MLILWKEELGPAKPICVFDVKPPTARDEFRGAGIPRVSRASDRSIADVILLSWVVLLVIGSPFTKYSSSYKYGNVLSDCGKIATFPTVVKKIESGFKRNAKSLYRRIVLSNVERKRRFPFADNFLNAISDIFVFSFFLNLKIENNINLIVK